uniref:CCHC-type domain-containing protein n=1 Tax=Nicotiana tabacum TaxID=4097 RepID=A0A1S4A6T3_TOBAC|nr:PREDICTED: uncharacterized protein LOC107794308 [Nicotiana tabacum]
MDLKNVDIKIESADQALTVLCSLSPFYDTFADTLPYGKERRTQQKNFNRKKSIARSKSRAWKQNFYECGEQGHYKRDCPELKEKRGKQKVDNSANIVDTCGNSDDSDYVGEVCASPEGSAIGVLVLQLSQMRALVRICDHYIRKICITFVKGAVGDRLRICKASLANAKGIALGANRFCDQTTTFCEGDCLRKCEVRVAFATFSGSFRQRICDVFVAFVNPRSHLLDLQLNNGI